MTANGETQDADFRRRLAETVQFLNEQTPGFQPYPLFLALTRLTVTSTVELVPIRSHPETGQTQILLKQRPETDDFWPNQWHVPGSVILSPDEVSGSHDYSAALGRLINEDGELKGEVKVIGGPIELETEHRSPEVTGRGAELSVIHYAIVEGKPTDGVFVDANGFPGNAPGTVIKHHVGFIGRAVAAYEQRLGQPEA